MIDKPLKRPHCATGFRRPRWEGAQSWRSFLGTRGEVFPQKRTRADPARTERGEKPVEKERERERRRGSSSSCLARAMEEQSQPRPPGRAALRFRRLCLGKSLLPDKICRSSTFWSRCSNTFSGFLCTRGFLTDFSQIVIVSYRKKSKARQKRRTWYQNHKNLQNAK